MMRTIMTMSAALGLILAGGCSEPEAVVPPEVGTYELDVQVFRDEVLKGAEGKEPNSLQETLLTRIDGMSGSLVLKADGSCKMTTSDGVSTTEDSGTWRLEGQKLFLDGKDRASQEPVTTELSLVDGVAKMASAGAPGGFQVFRKAKKN